MVEIDVELAVDIAAHLESPDPQDAPSLRNALVREINESGEWHVTLRHLPLEGTPRVEPRVGDLAWHVDGYPPCEVTRVQRGRYGGWAVWLRLPDGGVKTVPADNYTFTGKEAEDG